MYVVVAGGGHMGTHLVARLVAEGHEVAVIDVDPTVTERIFTEVGVVAFTGHATDLVILEQAGIKRADVAVAMTGRDSDNLSFCLLARYYGVPRVLARMLNPQYEVPYRLVGATKIHSEAEILVNSFLTSIEYPQVGALMRVGRGDLVVFELRIPSGSPVAGQTIATIVKREDFPGHTVFIGVEAEEGVEVADGSTVITPGTSVILAAQRTEVAQVVRCLTDVGGTALSPEQVRALEALRGVSFLSGVSQDDLTELAATSKAEARARGDIVYRIGDPGDRLYVLRSGKVEIQQRDGTRAEQRSPGFFGERTALTGQPRSREVRVLEDAEMVAVDGSALRLVLLRNPFVAVEIAKLISQRPGPRG